MSANFSESVGCDPYYQWLGIPPDEQPANHYRLLGIRSFEGNAEVIATAGDHRLIALKTYQIGPHGQLSQHLMNEVSAATACLLNREKKAEYDVRLREQQAAAQGLEVTADEAGLVAELGLAIDEVEQARRTRPTSVAKKRKRSALFYAVGTAVGGVVASILLLLVVFRATHAGPRVEPPLRPTRLGLAWPVAERNWRVLLINGRTQEVEQLAKGPAPDQLVLATQPGEYRVRIESLNQEPFERVVKLAKHQQCIIPWQAADRQPGPGPLPNHAMKLNCVVSD
jgi:hypothetical protein